MKHAKKPIEFKRSFIVELFRSVHYELKYLSEKNRAKSQYYIHTNEKANLQEQLEEKNKTILHQKETISSLREEVKALREEPVITIKQDDEILRIMNDTKKEVIKKLGGK